MDFEAMARELLDVLDTPHDYDYSVATIASALRTADAAGRAGGIEDAADKLTALSSQWAKIVGTGFDPAAMRIAQELATAAASIRALAVKEAFQHQDASPVWPHCKQALHPMDPAHWLHGQPGCAENGK